jgi:hypothetical protein
MAAGLGALALIVIGIPLVAVIAAWTVAMRRIERHGFIVILWRWLSGAAWHGNPVTDAGFLRPGKSALTRTGHATRFHHRPRLHRALIRSGGTVAVVLGLYGLIVARPVTVLAAGSAAAALLAYGGWRAWRGWRRRAHRRTWLDPLHVAVAPLVGVPLPNKSSSWLQVEQDRSKAVLALPPGFTGTDGERDKLARAVAAKLGLEAPEVRWSIAGPEPTLTLIRSEPPPQKVSLADIRPAIVKAGPDELVLGLGKKAAPVKVSLHSDSPHVGASMGSGAGKSTLARVIAAQVLYRGGIVLIIDTKVISHMWARGLPNTAYADTPAAIHNALIWLGAELERRNRVALAAADVEGDVRANVGPRLLVIAEELNMTMNRLRAYWTDVKEPSDPPRSPAVTALEDVAFAGRQVRINLLMIGQMLSAKATGSGEARENIGVRLLARYTERNWKMLVPEHVMPPASGVPGRVQVIASGTVRETQIAYATGTQARELAMAGTVTPCPAGMPGAQGPAVTGTPRPALGDSTAGQPCFPVTDGPMPVAPPGGMITLAEAVKAGILPMSLAAARAARHRDKSFPQPAGMRGIAHVYSPEALAAYRQERS